MSTGKTRELTRKRARNILLLLPCVVVVVVDISEDVAMFPPVRLVVDTSVVVAAFRSASGASNALLRCADTGVVTLLCSTALFLEYEAVLSRLEVRNATGHTLREVEAVMDAFALIAEPVDVHFRTRPLLRDADDEMVVEVASNGAADFIVTHNLRDFAPARTLGIEVATPSEIVGRLRHE